MGYYRNFGLEPNYSSSSSSGSGNLERDLNSATHGNGGNVYDFISRIFGGDFSSNVNDFLKGDSEDYTSLINDIKDAISGAFNENWTMWNDLKNFNSEQSTIAFERQKQLIDYQAKVSRELRNSAYQDTVNDLVKAGINPAVFFSAGGNAGSLPTFSAGNVSSASVSNPNSDKVSSLANAVGNILSAVASNKNADSAVLRSIIGIFSGNVNLSSIDSSSNSNVNLHK